MEFWSDSHTICTKKGRKRRSILQGRKGQEKSSAVLCAWLLLHEEGQLGKKEKIQFHGQALR